jgi:TolB-like protein/Flp pilus assembly protein TadD
LNHKRGRNYRAKNDRSLFAVLKRIIIGVLALVILVMAADTISLTPIDKSIAVLPFVNHSAGARNARFFPDGIHADLLANISKIHELKVISRTSVMAYRDTTKSRRQIGEELGIGSLLEGGVQLSGDRLQINVQLTHAQTDEHLWAETYDSRVTTKEIFKIQSEITRAVASALQATLTPTEEDALGRFPTRNLEAYETVLIARQLARGRSYNTLARGAEYARKAIKLDPEYADAHLTLADTLIRGINTRAWTNEEAGAEISASIDTAMSLQSDNDEAWTVLGQYQSSVGANQGAEQSFEKAMRLNPGSAQTLYDYGDMLQSVGRPQDALPLLLKSRELDPLSVDVHFALGSSHDVMGDHEAARLAFAQIRKIEPSNPLGFTSVSGSYISQGLLDEATYWLRKGLAVDPKDPELGGWMVFLNDCLEDYSTAEEWSDWLDNWVTNQAQPMAMQARHHYLTGNFETAIQYSNLALNLGLPNRGGSDGIFMRIKRDEALAVGDPEAGIDVFRKHHPGLLKSKPEISPDNMLQAVDLALLLKMSGRTEKAQLLIDAVLEFYERPWSTSGAMRARLVPARAEALAILGDDQAALAELRRIIDNGWRTYWRWETDLNPNFNGIRESEVFLALVNELETDMAIQRHRTQAMADRGEIAPPPEGGITE